MKILLNRLIVFSFTFFISCSIFVKKDFLNSGDVKYKKELRISNQLITVTPHNTSYAIFKLWEKDKNNIWNKIDEFDGRIGGRGMSSNKQEGDKKTPTGVFALKEGFGIKKISTKIKYRNLNGSEYWVDDYNSPFYNTMQIGLGKNAWNSSEHLVENKVEYQYVVVIDYNRYPVIKKRGSAIFLHVENNKETSGCVGVPKKKMIKILKWLDPNKNPKIILGY